MSPALVSPLATLPWAGHQIRKVAWVQLKENPKSHLLQKWILHSALSEGPPTAIQSSRLLYRAWAAPSPPLCQLRVVGTDQTLF